MAYNNLLIRNLYSPGFSFIMISFYKTGLTFGFTPWVSTDNTGRSQYDKKRFQSTTIDYDKAAALYLAATKVLNGTDKQQVQLVLQCNNNTILAFEYKPDQNGRMKAYLVLEKNRSTIPFEFVTREQRIKQNGQMCTVEVQSGLTAFAMVLQAYLVSVNGESSTMNEEESQPMQFGSYR